MAQIIKAGRIGPGQVFLPPRQPATNRVVQVDEQGRVVIKRSKDHPSGVPPVNP